MSTEASSVLPKLRDGANFSNWRFRLQLILEEKGLDGALKKEPKAEKNVDAKARSVVVQCLSDKFIDIVKKCSTAHEMLTKLEEIFERKSVFNKLYLRKKLLSLKCNENLQDHFLKFEKVISELEGTGTTLDESDKVCHLLLTLPDDYNTVITTLETMDKELTIDFVKSRMLDAELKLKGQQRNTNLDADTQSFLACFKCGKRGHKAYHCRSALANSRGRAPERGNQYHRGQRYSSHRGRGSRSLWQTGNVTHTGNQGNEQDMMFTAFSASDVDVSETVQLVIDSGATEHLFKDQYLPYMTNVQNLENEIKIYVANGQYMSSTKKGKLNLKYKNCNIEVSECTKQEAGDENRMYLCTGTLPVDQTRCGVNHENGLIVFLNVIQRGRLLQASKVKETGHMIRFAVTESVDIPAISDMNALKSKFKDSFSIFQNVEPLPRVRPTVKDNTRQSEKSVSRNANDSEQVKNEVTADIVTKMTKKQASVLNGD